jgi:hypothetical protein
MAGTSFIGSTIGVVSGSPATEDAAGYGAQTFAEILRVVSISELGDNSEDISYDILKDGRRTHVNGVFDMGEITVVWEYNDVDPGQVACRDAAGTNTTHSFEVTDADGQIQWFQGVVASVRDMERTSSTYKGQTMVIRPQTGLTE